MRINRRDIELIAEAYARQSEEIVDEVPEYAREIQDFYDRYVVQNEPVTHEEIDALWSSIHRHPAFKKATANQYPSWIQPGTKIRSNMKSLWADINKKWSENLHLQPGAREGELPYPTA